MRFFGLWVSREVVWVGRFFLPLNDPADLSCPGIFAESESREFHLILLSGFFAFGGGPASGRKLGGLLFMLLQVLGKAALGPFPQAQTAAI